MVSLNLEFFILLMTPPETSELATELATMIFLMLFIFIIHTEKHNSVILLIYKMNLDHFKKVLTTMHVKEAATVAVSPLVGSN